MKARLLLTVLTLVFTFQSMAAAGSGVKEAFDEFRYTMEVEGAALDPHAAREATEKLSQVLATADIKESLNLIQDEKAKADIEALMAQVKTEKLTPAQTQSILRSIAEKSYAEGASWNGEVVPMILGSIIMTAILGYVIMIVFFPKWMIRNGYMDCPSNYSEAQCADWYDTQTTGTPPGWEPGMPFIHR